MILMIRCSVLTKRLSTPRLTVTKQGSIESLHHVWNVKDSLFSILNSLGDCGLSAHPRRSL